MMSGTNTRCLIAVPNSPAAPVKPQQLLCLDSNHRITLYNAHGEETGKKNRVAISCFPPIDGVASFFTAVSVLHN